MPNVYIERIKGDEEPKLRKQKSQSKEIFKNYRRVESGLMITGAAILFGAMRAYDVSRGILSKIRNRHLNAKGQ